MGSYIGSYLFSMESSVWNGPTVKPPRFDSYTWVYGAVLGARIVT